ncbi:hypothetical protein B0H63DRAFT_464706 [Podospora didyma]|uniref:Zn(2)-C6 fungal-type domain-containing protein n=1 Tax=Podospora didyma TaxID=330526 RepID=A0AAE0NYM7_9PEZI|nr:hypothetical protein B0H63DRAFT_464706 [Podospora didyma]
MESTAATTYQPPSRQKNCSCCVQAKRRCDRKTPICSRCADKQLPCIYAPKYTKVASQHVSATTSSEDAPPFDSPAYSSLFSPGQLSFDFDGFLGILPPDTHSARPHATVDELTITADVSMDDAAAFMHMVDNNATSTSPFHDMDVDRQWLVSRATSTDNPPPRPSTPADDEIARSYKKMEPFCHHFEPWHLYDPKSTLHYVTNRVKSFTNDMATRNATPFLHRYLYRDYTPQCILSCFATSVLYTSRTPANTAMVMQAIYTSVRELVDGGQSDEAASGHHNKFLAGPTVTPVEKLARVQALFLYQAIRLFDGDVGLRAQAEKDMALLQTWVGELCDLRENLGDLARSGEDISAALRAQPPKDWERWIFAESARRTIVMCYAVIMLFALMKDPDGQTEIDPGPWAYVHRWTLSRSLWEAGSSFEFDRMWKERPQFVVANFALESFLGQGRAEDVDEFAEIMLSVYIGVDETKEFVSGRLGVQSIQSPVAAAR